MSEKTTAVFKTIIHAPIEKVWEELTKVGVNLPFFFHSTCQTPGMQSGAPMRMVSRDGKHTGVIGEILEFDPPRRYAHSFRFTAYDDPTCKVIYELEPVEGGTEFTVIAEDIPVGTKTAKQMVAGLKYIANNLKSIVETGKPNFMGRFVGLMTRLFGAPARCLSSEWELDTLKDQLRDSPES